MLTAQRLLFAVIVGGTAIAIVHFWLGVGGAAVGEAAEGPLYSSVIVAAGLACLLRAQRAERERYAWLLLGLAVLGWALGGIYGTWHAAGERIPHPSAPEAVYFAAYGLAVGSLVLFLRAKVQNLDWLLWLDGLIAALGTAALGTAFVFDSVAAGVSGGPAEVLAALAYPLGDILLLSLVVGMIALTGWRPGRIGLLLANAIALMLVADIASAVQGEVDPAAVADWVRPIYLLAAACLGAIAWQPLDRPINTLTSSFGRQELAVPVVFAIVMSGLFALQFVSPPTTLSTALRAATIFAIVLRLAIGTARTRSLLEQVRTDPLTKLGNRLQLEGELVACCAAATARRPAALLVLDLDGFKAYNDGLGHPAGDALLSRLGPALRRAVGPDGSTYRVGGDEFCVLLKCHPQRFEAVARRCVAALGAEERGVSVTASCGMALVPTEAEEPLAALQLADARMYADKESRRGPVEHLPLPDAEPDSQSASFRVRRSVEPSL